MLQFRVTRALISVSRAREVFDALCGHPAHAHFSGVAIAPHDDPFTTGHYLGDDPVPDTVPSRLVVEWAVGRIRDILGARFANAVNNRQHVALDAFLDTVRQDRVEAGDRLRLSRALARRVRAWRRAAVTRPTCPSARPPVDDPEGWGAIDAVEVVDCAVNHFVLYEDLDGRDVEWAIVVSSVLDLWASGSPLNVERALKWFFILPQLLLRLPPRGGRRGKGQVNSRFQAWSDRRLGQLLRWWRDDCDALDLAAIPSVPSDDAVLARALALFRDRQMGKAVALLVGLGKGVSMLLIRPSRTCWSCCTRPCPVRCRSTAFLEALVV